MNNGKRRRLAKAARKVVGNDSMSPTTTNLVRIMRGLAPRYERRHAWSHASYTQAARARSDVSS